MLDTIKDSAKDLFANVNSRLTNPFLGTLIFVWIVRNFEFVFTLFNFDDKITRIQKINIINEYFKDYCIIWETIKNIFYTSIILIVTFVLLLGFRFIVNKYKDYLNKVNSISPTSDMVDRSLYEKLFKVYSQLKSENEQLGNASLEHKSQIVQIETEKNELVSKIAAKDEVIENLNLVIDKKNHELIQLAKKLGLIEKNNKELLHSETNLKARLLNIKITNILIINHYFKESFKIKTFFEEEIVNLIDKNKFLLENDKVKYRTLLQKQYDNSHIHIIYLIGHIYEIERFLFNLIDDNIVISEIIVVNLIKDGIIVRNTILVSSYTSIKHLKLTPLGEELFKVIKKYFEVKLEYEKHKFDVLKSIS